MTEHSLRSAVALPVDQILNDTVQALSAYRGTNPGLSTSEVCGSGDSGEKFVEDFVAARGKVMNLDRFDVK